MASRVPTVLRKHFLYQHTRAGRLTRAVSSAHKRTSDDPSKHVHGVSVRDLESNPVLKAYFEANFPETSQEVLDELAATEAAALLSPKEMVEEKRLSELSKLNIRTLIGYERDLETEEGTNKCYRLRDNMMIPGIVYGGDPTQNMYSGDDSTKILVKTPWNELHRELNKYHHNHSFESRVYDMTVYQDPQDEVGTIYRVVPRDVQWHPIKQKIYCSNYLRYFPGRPIKIPIAYINQEDCRAMKAGGFIAPINRYVECVVEDGVPIPETIDLDCTGMRLKEVVRMDRLIFPEGVKPSTRIKNPKMFLIGTVFGRRALVGDEDEEGEAAETEEKKE